METRTAPARGSVRLSEWLRLLDAEYLTDFIRDGGAAVKILVHSGQGSDALLKAVADAAEKRDYRVASVRASDVRIQHIDRIFTAVARQIDWDSLAEQRLRLMFEESGIIVESDQPLSDADRIARKNERTVPELRGEVNRLIVNHVLRDYSMSREFRTAMAMLCSSRVNAQNVPPTEANLIKDWLQSDRVSLTALKRVQIYQKVGIHNARLFLNSLSYWVRKAGFPGLALLLNLDALGARAARDVQPAGSEPSIRYSRAAVLDTYEALRQFIDQTDEAGNLLVVAGAGNDLVDDQQRGFQNYTALEMRTVDEVRDVRMANPLNVLVRIAPLDTHSVPPAAASNPIQTTPETLLADGDPGD